MSNPQLDNAMRVQIGELIGEAPSDVDLEVVGEYVWPGNLPGDAVRITADDPTDLGSDEQRMWLVVQAADGSAKIVYDGPVTQGKVQVPQLLVGTPPGNATLYRLKTMFGARPTVQIAKIDKAKVEEAQNQANAVNNEGVLTGLTRTFDDIGASVGKFAKTAAIIGLIGLGILVALRVTKQ